MIAHSKKIFVIFVLLSLCLFGIMGCVKPQGNAGNAGNAEKVVEKPKYKIIHYCPRTDSKTYYADDINFSTNLVSFYEFSSGKFVILYGTIEVKEQ